MAFKGIIERSQFEKSWRHERFLVNGKYLIVHDATLHNYHDNLVLVTELQAREPLTRSDLNEFKRKVKQNFDEDITIRTRITYIL